MTDDLAQWVAIGVLIVFCLFHGHPTHWRRP